MALRRRTLATIGIAFCIVGILVIVYGNANPLKVAKEKTGLLASKNVEFHGTWRAGWGPPTGCYFSVTVDRSSVGSYRLEIQVRSDSRVTIAVASQETWKANRASRDYIYADMWWRGVKMETLTYSPPSTGTYYLFVVHTSSGQVSRTYFEVNEVYKVEESQTNWSVIQFGIVNCILGLGIVIESQWRRHESAAPTLPRVNPLFTFFGKAVSLIQQCRKRVCIARSAGISLVVLSLLVCGAFSIAYAQGFFDKTCSRCNGTGHVARIHRTDLVGWWSGWNQYAIRATFHNEGPEDIYRTVVCYTEQHGRRVEERSFLHYFPVGSTTVTRSLSASGGYTGRYNMDLSNLNTTCRVGYNMDLSNPDATCPNCGGKGNVHDYTKIGATIFGAVLVVITGTILATRRSLWRHIPNQQRT